MDTLLLLTKPGYRKAMGTHLLLHLQHILPTFIILNVLLGCGSGKSNKIRLHARDSADVAMSGTWITAGAERKDSLEGSEEHHKEKESIDKFVLREDHSALIYKKERDSVKELKGRWIWNKNKQSLSTASLSLKSDGRHGDILILQGPASDSTVVLNLTPTRQNQETILNASGLCSFRKEN